MADAPKRRGRPPADKPKTKPNPKNPLEVIKPPKLANYPNAVELPEGDNNKYTSFALSVMRMPKIDLQSPEQVRQRVVDYFQLCADLDMKPAVNGLAISLGMDRRRLWEIKTDQDKQPAIPAESKLAIKSAYDNLELLWETYMQNGKINPVSGIFMAKNYWNYADKQEYVLTPNQMGEVQDARTIEAKYAELPDE